MPRTRIVVCGACVYCMIQACHQRYSQHLMFISARRKESARARAFGYAYGSEAPHDNLPSSSARRPNGVGGAGERMFSQQQQHNQLMLQRLLQNVGRGARAGERVTRGSLGEEDFHEQDKLHPHPYWKPPWAVFVYGLSVVC